MKTGTCQDNVAPKTKRSDDPENELDNPSEQDKPCFNYARGAKPGFFELQRFVSEEEDLAGLHAELTCHCGRMTFTGIDIVDAVSEHFANDTPNVP